LNSYKPLSINKKIIVFFLKKFLILLPIRKLAYEIEARSQLGKCNSKYVACVVWGYKEKELLERKCFDKYILKEFEGHFFYVLQGYDRYLTNLYGDYMQLPPVHKRCSPHTISNIYWK
jgi:lipopolysaccharide cholinephosphotransferase